MLNVRLSGLFSTMAAVVLMAGPVQADLVVYHGKVAAPAYIDQGEKGESAGDVRVWHFEGKTGEGATVVMEFIMTTTGVDTAGKGAESRVTTGVFSFGGPVQDQIVIQGVGLYAGADSTFKPNSQLVRAIIGGTGKYKGAKGELISTHKEDDTWEHVFKLD